MYNKYKVNSKRRKMFYKIFFSYFLIFTIPLFIIVAIGTNYLSKSLRRQIDSSYTINIEDKKNIIDEKLNYLSQFSIQLSQLRWVKKLMYSSHEAFNNEAMDVTAISQYITELSVYNYLSSISIDTSIYFKDKDCIMSTTGLSTVESYFNDTFRFENPNLSQWSESINHINSFNIVSSNNAFHFGKPYNIITYMQSLPPIDKNFKATLLVFIDENKIKDLLKTNNTTNVQEILVVDNQNKLVATTFSNIAKSEELLRNARGIYLDNENSSPFNLGGYRIYRTISVLNNWSYLMIVPRKTIDNSLNYVNVIEHLAIIFIFAVGIFLSCILAKYNYKPIENIISYLKGNSVNYENDTDEISYINKSIQNILENNYKINDQLLFSKPLARKACMLKLLSNNDDNMDIVNALDNLDVTFKYKYFSCGIILPDNICIMNDKLKVGISEIDNMVDCFFIDSDSKLQIILTNFSQKEYGLKWWDSMQGFLKAEKITYKAIGVGHTYDDISFTYKSYNEAKSALAYSFIKEPQSVISYAYINKSEMQYYSYSLQEEEHILNYIKAGEYLKAIDTFRIIKDRNMAKLNIHPNMLKNMLYNLAVFPLRVCEELKIEIGKDFFNIESIFKMDSSEEIIAYIEKLYLDICDIVIEKKESRNIDRRNNILEYIYSNLYNKDLSLTYIAEKMSLSPSYLSRFIKDQTGYNFVEYINTNRITKAKNLLIEDYSIIQIAKIVGYDNDITFRRLFKKYEGLTPSEYKVEISKNQIL